MKFRIGTRGSELALWQAHFVQRELAARGHACEIVVLKTRGDVIDDVPLTQVEGKAFFTAEIERALLDGSVDLAVHSHKDLAVESPPGLVVAAIPRRASAAERLLVRREAWDASAAFLPLRSGARVGTSAPRRAEQLRALRPDLELADLRGNVPTRVRRLREGRYDAIVLAAAGLDRLALDVTSLGVVELPAAWFAPAPAQGALAVQARSEDRQIIECVRAALHCPETERCIAAERLLLSRAGGGCNLPLGALVGRDGDGYSAQVFFGTVPQAAGPGPRWAEARGPTPELAAQQAWERLGSNSATRAGPLGGLRVAMTGGEGDGSLLAERLARLGAELTQEVVLCFERLGSERLGPALKRLRTGDWVALTSRRAARCLAGHPQPAGVRAAAVGPATARELAAAGWRADHVGAAGATELGRALPIERGARVLFPCAALARSDLERELATRGVQVERCELYRTRPVEPPIDLAVEVDARVYASPSAVEAALAWERAHPSANTERLALGQTTARALAQHGLAAWCAAGEELDSATGLAEAVVRHLASRQVARAAPLASGKQ
jgi:hydroxymethylbilane synthase